MIALGLDGPNAFKRFWEVEGMPFIGLADIKSVAASRYHQEVNWVKLGRMPAVLVINKKGRIAFSHYGESMSDIPKDQVIFEVLDRLNQEE